MERSLGVAYNRTASCARMERGIPAVVLVKMGNLRELRSGLMNMAVQRPIKVVVASARHRHAVAPVIVPAASVVGTRSPPIHGSRTVDVFPALAD